MVGVRPQTGGVPTWEVRMGQSSLCSQKLLRGPRGSHSPAGAGSVHFQASPDREELKGALHHRCGNGNTEPGGGGVQFRG